MSVRLEEGAKPSPNATAYLLLSSMFRFYTTLELTSTAQQSLPKPSLLSLFSSAAAVTTPLLYRWAA